MSSDFQKPRIAIPEADHERLTALSAVLERRNPDLAEQLIAELSRADIVSADRASTVISMGSTLDYTTASGETRTVTLVFPGEEDIALGRVSVLTPIGVALIGLSAGDTMEWRRSDGRTQTLTVTRIAPAHAGVEAVPA